jgi:glycosyltransferase involved in cell wall biosynthesis
MFSLVMATMGCTHFLKQTFEVVFDNKDIHQVIIVDNTPDNSTMAFLNSIKNDKLSIIRNNVNQGVIKSRNQGLCLARSEYTIILDDDQVPLKDRNTFDKYKELLGKFDILGCEPQIMDLRTGLTKFGNESNFSYVGAGGMCMKTVLWKELGLFDEIFSPSYFEDPDLCIKAKRRGYTIGLVKDHAIVHHQHRTLFRKDLGFSPDDVMIRNRKIFMARYGVKPKPNKTIHKPAVVLSKDRSGLIKVMHILSNINIGGVQQNAIYLAKGLADRGFHMGIYVAEAAKRGLLEKHIGKDVSLYYNKKVSSRNSVKVFKNISHSPQSIIDPSGRIIVVKPGGTLRDLGYNLSQIRGFRLDSVIPAELNVSIVDAIVKYKPSIVHYHRDVSRISRDVTRLKSMPEFKDIKIVRTVHGSKLPDLTNYDLAVLLTKQLLKGAQSRYPKMNTVAIPNGIDTNIFKPSGCPKEHICITHTRLSKILKLTHRPELYFEVVRKVCDIDKEVKFILVGPDYEIYKSRFDVLIKRFNLKDKLEIKPPLYNKDLANYINKAKVWFYPTSEDAFPLSVLEAMACGLPIVASSLVGISEMITSHESGLLSDPSDVDSFVTNLLRCLKDKDLAMNMGDIAYKKAVEAYSLESMLEKYSNLYLELMRT